ncbi:hypothetical protein NADFUDRAFT_65893 [Nadsonia fulvescens var. elongata DSM 6958]|uniref:Myb-like domain-containing protein n=1 Tax=Nadsonia fulvescens var. elongata DSM 6958 TaxID=857566 RepID=A0A1E3PKW5_9ASCO|nr:hypothetical protein NADFUDRAFT_65893 [Nadsonia fulvescens var. elongata DSM 6958]
MNTKETSNLPLPEETHSFTSTNVQGQTQETTKLSQRLPELVLPYSSRRPNDQTKENVKSKQTLSLKDRMRLNESYIALYNKELYEFATGLPSESTSKMRNPLKRSRMSLNGTYNVKKTDPKKKKKSRICSSGKTDGRFDLGTGLAEDEDSEMNSEDENEEQNGNDEDRDIEYNEANEISEEDYLMDGFVAGSYWLAQEKEMFFNYLGRTTRHNLSEIARRIVTKSLVEIEEYHDLLFNATQYYKNKFSESNQLPEKLPYTFGNGTDETISTQNTNHFDSYEMNPQYDGKTSTKKYIVGMDEMPIAREMSENWINMEERQTLTDRDYAAYFTPGVLIEPFKDTIYKDLEDDALKSLFSAKDGTAKLERSTQISGSPSVVDVQISDPSTIIENGRQENDDVSNDEQTSTEEQSNESTENSLINIQELARLSERCFYNAPYDRDPNTFEFRSRAINIQKFEHEFLQELEQLIRIHTRKILSQLYFNELNASYKGDGTKFAPRRLIASRDVYRVLAQLNHPSNLKQGFWRKWAIRSNAEVFHCVKKPTRRSNKYCRKTQNEEFMGGEEGYGKSWIPGERLVPRRYLQFISQVPEYTRTNRRRYKNHLETSHSDPKFCDSSRYGEYLKALRGPNVEDEALIADSEDDEDSENDDIQVELEEKEKTGKAHLGYNNDSDEGDADFSDDYPEDFEDILDDAIDQSEPKDIIDFSRLDKIFDEELYYIAEEFQLNKNDLELSRKEEFVLLNYINSFEAYDPLDGDEIAHLRIYEKSCLAYAKKCNLRKETKPPSGRYPPSMAVKDFQDLYSAPTEEDQEELLERESSEASSSKNRENFNVNRWSTEVNPKKLALFLKSIPSSGFTISEDRLEL